MALNSYKEMSRRRFDKPYIIYRIDSEGNEGFWSIEEYVQLFGKTPGYHAIHYGTSGFEGILGIVSDTKPNALNVLTLDKNVNRLMHTMETFSLVKGKNDDRLSQIYQEIKEKNPDLPLSARAVPKYMNVDPQHFANEVIPQALAKNYESGALKLDASEDNKRVYFRPIASKGEKFVLSGPEDSVLTMGLGVGSLQHEGVLELIVNNVPPYLKRKGNGKPPTAIIFEKELVEGLLESVGVDDPIRKVKAAANYAFGGIANGVAAKLGFTEALLLDTNGYALEGCGENLYVAKGDTLYTPSLDQSILPGTKRALVLAIAKILGTKVKEGPIKMDDLFNADAIAFSGTWTGFEPLHAIYRYSDNKKWIAKGANPIIEAIKQVYDNIIYDRKIDNPQLANLQEQTLFPIKYNA